MKTIIALLFLAGCAKPAGGPLSQTFDNTKLAAVALDQKQAVTLAQQAHDVALLQHKLASSAYRESEIEEDLAEHQAERAVVVSFLVASRQPDAKPAPATNESSAQARKVAGAKLAFMEARRAWLRKASDGALYEVYATQARLELERAKVAQANRLVGADFNVDAYQKQADTRGSSARSAADATESERKQAEAKLAGWAELEGAYLKTSGLAGPLESSRYAPEVKPREPTPPPVVEPPAPPPADAPPAPPPAT
jgi:hypothetical protein